MKIIAFVFALAVLCSVLYLIIDDVRYIWEVQQWINLTN